MGREYTDPDEPIPVKDVTDNLSNSSENRQKEYEGETDDEPEEDETEEEDDEEEDTADDDTKA
jgi:hypothetical protein